MIDLWCGIQAEIHKVFGMNVPRTYEDACEIGTRKRTFSMYLSDYTMYAPKSRYRRFASLFPHRHDHPRPHVLVGIMAKTKMPEFEVRLGGQTVHISSPVADQSFQPVLHNTFLPLIMVSYHECELRFELNEDEADRNVSLLYGILPVVRGVSLNSWASKTQEDRWLLINGGMASIIESSQVKVIDQKELVQAGIR